MKGYRNFLIVFGVLLILYIVAQLNKTEPLNWRVTVSKDDKNPYGGYVLFHQLKSIFPDASIESYRLPVYNQVNNYNGSNTAYIIVGPSFIPTKEDVKEMHHYVYQGNFVIASADAVGKIFSDTLGFSTAAGFALFNDSTSINFVNPALKSDSNYIFRQSTIDEYFSKVDTSRTIILGLNNRGKPNFIKVNIGEGAFYIHASPVCFSNYFMLFNNNAEYTAKALSYLPEDVTKIYWDEYYKLGPGGAATPLRFFLTNPFLLWALRLSIIGLIVYVLFEMKRRQRVIPVITPLRNTTLDFAKTVASVYFNQKDNNSIAQKKISYFLEFVRQRFYLPTQLLDDNFIQQLSRKSGVLKTEVEQLVMVLREIELGYKVEDNLLLSINRHIDHFYKQVR